MLQKSSAASFWENVRLLNAKEKPHSDVYVDMH
jgi:hypothetical protein